VQISVGNGRAGEEALFGVASSGAYGSVRFFGGIPGGGTSRGTVYVHATKPCPPNVQPVGQVDNVDVYDCGVGGASFRPQDFPAASIIELELRIGAASQQDAVNAPIDCGAPLSSPYPQAMRLRPDPLQLDVSKTGFVTTRFVTARGTEQLYDFRWEIDDRSIAELAAGTPTGVFEVEVVGKAQGTTTITGYRQNMMSPGHPAEEATDSATIVVAGGAPIPPPPGEPHTFGWERAITQRDMMDFMLPHACVVGLNLEDIVHARSPANGGCSIRMNQDEGCATCHRMGAEDPTLQGIPKNAFCDLVPRFIANPAAATDPRATKPQNLKDFFNDWYERRDAVTGECPD
jgi:hypothetical protein